jgi:nucleotide-binding universal stress UspA family protein
MGVGFRVEKRKKFPSRRIKRILVATDFSAASKKAVEYASVLAKAACAEVILMHAIDSLPYSVTDTFNIIDHRRALRKTASFLLESLRSELADSGIPVKARLAMGPAHEEIIKSARKEKADLIVVGTMGRTGVSHIFLGSVAEKVVRLADCPVVTIPVRRRKRLGRSR